MSCVEKLIVHAIEEEPYFESSNEINSEEPVNQSIPAKNVQPAQSDPLIHPFRNKTIKNKGGCTRHKAICPSCTNTKTFACRSPLTISSLGGLQLHKLRAHPEEYYSDQPLLKKFSGQLRRQTN